MSRLELFFNFQVMEDQMDFLMNKRVLYLPLAELVAE